jgi:hypothetical protein
MAGDAERSAALIGDVSANPAMAGRRLLWDLGAGPAGAVADGIGDRTTVGRLTEAVQGVTGESVTLAYVDQDYTGEQAAEAAHTQGITLHVVKLPEAKRSFVLLPRCGVVERSFA